MASRGKAREIEDDEDDDVERGDFQCSNCRRLTHERKGQCPHCEKWNTLSEIDLDDNRGRALPITVGGHEQAIDRISTGFKELDRVLGTDDGDQYGAAVGSVIILGGDPGIGKSTLLLEAAYNIAEQHGPVIVASAEENRRNIRIRGKRIDSLHDDLFLLTDLDGDLARIEEEVRAIRPVCLILDSAQTLRHPDLDSEVGSIPQQKKVAKFASDMATEYKMPVFLVSHVNKDGAIAGPNTLKHLVDAVLLFDGAEGAELRTLRADGKNRYGSTMEVGLFRMTDKGMLDLENASAYFLKQRRHTSPGNVVTAMCRKNTNRAILMEVQTCMIPTPGLKRSIITDGVSATRVSMILAILERRCKLFVGSVELYVNVIGGLESNERATDLAIAIAIASERTNIPVRSDAVVFGEVGLEGEIRDVLHVPSRLKEAESMSFKAAIVPTLSDLLRVNVDVNMNRCETLDDAVRAALGETYVPGQYGPPTGPELPEASEAMPLAAASAEPKPKRLGRGSR